MPRQPVSAAARKELANVDKKLEGNRLSQPDRLELLRRQAQLGDDRDAAIERARRAASER